MPQNAAVGAVYNPKGIPLTLTAASVNDWILVQQNATGRVGKMRLSVAVTPSLMATGGDDTGTAVDGGINLNVGDGVVKSEDLFDATEYTLTLSNTTIKAKSKITFEVTEDPDEGTPEITNLIVADAQALVTVTMDPPFTGALVFAFTVSN